MYTRRKSTIFLLPNMSATQNACIQMRPGRPETTEHGARKSRSRCHGFSAASCERDGGDRGRSRSEDMTKCGFGAALGATVWLRQVHEGHVARRSADRK